MVLQVGPLHLAHLQLSVTITFDQLEDVFRSYFQSTQKATSPGKAFSALESSFETNEKFDPQTERKHRELRRIHHRERSVVRRREKQLFKHFFQHSDARNMS